MEDALFSVRRQVVLVSGGSRGIGKAIARGFCQRGARVILTGRTAGSAQAAARELEEEGEVWGHGCDVAGSVAPLVEEVLGRHGRIDTLVNCAGINRRKPAETLTEEEYDMVMDTNLKGAWRLSQEVGRHMIERRSGCQIQIASINAERPLKNVLPYAMSKAAMARMAQALALEWGPYGVRVNALAPGFVLTDLTRELWSDSGMQAWGQANTPLERLGKPEDMVGAALFLASRAAAFLTGQVLHVDGGFTAGWRWPIPE